jgi:hypothetical protein
MLLALESELMLLLSSEFELLPLLSEGSSDMLSTDLVPTLGCVARRALAVFVAL